MCGDKSTTLYLCFYLLIRRLCSVGHVWRQVNHVLFVFLSFHFLCSVGHVWRQVNHVLFVLLPFN